MEKVGRGGKGTLRYRLQGETQSTVRVKRVRNVGWSSERRSCPRRQEDDPSITVSSHVDHRMTIGGGKGAILAYGDQVRAVAEVAGDLVELIVIVVVVIVETGGDGVHLRENASTHGLGEGVLRRRRHVHRVQENPAT